MPPVFAVNNVELEAKGVHLAIPDRFFAPPRSFPTVEVAGRVGALLAGPARTAAMKRRLLGRVYAATAAARETLEAELEDLLYGGVVLRTDNGQGTVKELEAIGTDLKFSAVAGNLAPVGSTFEWEVLCLDPVWRSPGLVNRGLPAGGRVSIPVGTAAAPWWITVFGPTSTTWTLKFRRANGELLATLTASGGPAQLSATTYVTINSDQVARRIENAGTPTNFGPYLSGDFPAGLSPESGWRANGEYGTVELSSGSGQLITHLRWLR